MTAEYEKGLKVIIAPVKNQTLLRDAAFEACIGKIGVITNYYSIQPNEREIFYMYTVRVDDEDKEVVLYGDEFQPYMKKKQSNTYVFYRYPGAYLGSIIAMLHGFGRTNVSPPLFLHYNPYLSKTMRQSPFIEKLNLTMLQSILYELFEKRSFSRRQT
ncbi:hypothetical protein ACFLYF_06205 [Chloroflexota bacterium]